MSTDLDCLFPEPVKCKAAGSRLIPLLALMASGCVDLQAYTLVYKDGVLYACVDASHEDSCHKVLPKQANPNDNKTPE